MPPAAPVAAAEWDLRGATNVPRELSVQPRFEFGRARILRIMRCRTPPSLSGARVTPRSPLLQQGALQLRALYGSLSSVPHETEYIAACAHTPDPRELGLSRSALHLRWDVGIHEFGGEQGGAAAADAAFADLPGERCGE